MTPVSKRHLWYRRAAVIGAMTVTAAGIGLHQAGVFAAAPSSNTAWSISLATANPSFGSTASFTVVDPPTKNNPEISVNCTQNGQNVYLGVNAQSSGPGWTSFTLWSPSWANAGGGAASCMVNLYYYTWQGKTETGVVYVAQTSFTTA